MSSKVFIITFKAIILTRICNSVISLLSKMFKYKELKCNATNNIILILSKKSSLY